MKLIPIEVKLEKSKRELVELVNKLCNEYELSCYLLNFILKEIMEEIQKGRKADIEMINNELAKLEKREIKEVNGKD